MGEDWPLNRVLPRGADFFSGWRGKIATRYQLTKVKVARQLLNYKKGKYLNTQVSILLNILDLDERLCKGMVVSVSMFVSLTLKRVCSLDASLSGSDFRNLCEVMSSLRLHPLHVRTSEWLQAVPRTTASISLLTLWSTGFETWPRGSPKLLLGYQMLSWNLRG